MLNKFCQSIINQLSDYAQEKFSFGNIYFREVIIVPTL